MYIVKMVKLTLSAISKNFSKGTEALIICTVLRVLVSGVRGGNGDQTHRHRVRLANPAEKR